MHGIIEGFYGTPWTWRERREVAASLAGAGMDTYVYAPKDDPLHRRHLAGAVDGSRVAR